MKRIFSLYREAFSGLSRNNWLLSLATFINRSGSMVLLFTSLYLTNDLGFSIAQAGMIMSFYGIGSVLGSYFGGWLTDRKNFYDIMMLSLISSGLILLLMLVVSTQVYLSAIIFLYSFTADMFRPANAAAIGIYSTVETRPRSVSLYRLAINLGFSAGPAVGGFVALYLGYKWLFVIDSFTSFAAAGMLYYFLPRPVTKKQNEENDVLKDKSTSAYRDKEYLIFIFLVVVYAVCFFQLFASIPQYFSKICNYNEDTIGLLLGLNGLLVVIIEMPLVTWLGKKKNVFPFIIAGAACIPVAYFILMSGQKMIIWAMMYTFMITMAEVFAMPFMMNYTLGRSRKERQGQYSALYSIAYAIAMIIAPLLGLGIAAKYGFDIMFYFFMLLGTLSSCGFIYLNKIREV